MTNKETFLSLCAARVVAVIMGRRQKKGKTKWKTWIQEWLKNRTAFEAFYILLAELRNLDVWSYTNFLCMDVTFFEELLQLTGPVITRQEPSKRSIIPSGLRKRQEYSPSAIWMPAYLQPPCWIFQASHVMPNSKKTGWRRSTSGSLLTGIESSFVPFKTFKSFSTCWMAFIMQQSTTHDTLFNIF